MDVSLLYGKTAMNTYYFLLATYVCMRALQVLTTTPALASTHENKAVKASRTHWFALHGLVLCARWGYGFIYVVAIALKKITIGYHKGASLVGYVRGLDYFNLLTSPLELSVNDNMRNVLVSVSLLSILADHFLANTFWKALFASSAVPEDKRNSLLFSKKPFADIITRAVATIVDFAAMTGLYVAMIQYTKMGDMIGAFVPAECHHDFFVFVVFTTIASSIFRIVTLGQGIGRKLSGASLVTCQGSELSIPAALVREAVYFVCCAGLLEPIIICFNEEQGNVVDLITSMRDVDALARTPYSPKEVPSSDNKTSPAPLVKSRTQKNTSKPKVESPVPSVTKKTPANSTSKKNKTTTKSEAQTTIQGIVSLSENVPITPVATKSKGKSGNTPKTTGKSAKKATTAKKRPRADEEEEEEPAPKSTRKNQKTPKRTLVEETPPTTTRKSTRKH